MAHLRALLTPCHVSARARCSDCAELRRHVQFGFRLPPGPVMGVIERLTADVASLKGALRTLRMTTPIAKNPTRVFPQVVLELADKYGDAPALLSDTRALHLPRACRALQPLRALGIGAGRAQGRHGLPDHAGPTRIPGDLGRHHARRRRGRARQHPSDRNSAGLLHQRRKSEAHHRGRGIVRITGERARRTSPATRRSGCTAMPTPISRASIARSTVFPAPTSRRPIFPP